MVVEWAWCGQACGEELTLTGHHIGYSAILVKKKRTGQDSQKKKSQSGNISPIWGEAPTVPIRTKICMVGSLPDVITCAKFQVEIFRGYDFTGGQISQFPIDF